METIIAENTTSHILARRKFFHVLLIGLILFSSLAIRFLKPPVISGDGTTYAEAMAVLTGGEIPAGFVPNRILTTFFGLETIILLSHIFGSIPTAWIVLNVFFYFFLSFLFYKIILTVFQSEKTALIGGLFLAGNYAMLEFGINYLMDIGGWAFYILSLYFTLQYMKGASSKFIFVAALTVGIGGLFKEYAFLGALPIGVALLYRHSLSWPFLKKSLMTAALACGPILIVSFFVFNYFHYTYFDWLGYNQETYTYQSKIVEYIKSFGSLFNFLGLVFLAGLYCLWKFDREIVSDRSARFFILGVVVSALPAFIWPAITQRVLFITVPAVILISCYAIKKYETYWYVFALMLVLYTLSNFFMDSYILNAVNVPI